MTERFKKLYFLCLLSGMLVLSTHLLYAQSTWAPHDIGYYHLLDRYEIRSGQFSNTYFTSFKPIGRESIASFAEKLQDSADFKMSPADVFNIQFLLNDNWEWTPASDVEQKPKLKYFYKAKPDFYHVRTEDFDLHLNPVLHLRAGFEKDSDIRPMVNTRGVEVRGMIDGKVGFYTFLAENQAVFPAYVRERIWTPGQEIVPGEAFWKRFKENGVDYFTARAYVSLKASKHIGVQFGHDRFFIGNGMRSLILSDFGNSYPFLKIQTQVWKFNYTNIFAQLRGNVLGSVSGSGGTTRYPKKFMAMHHFSFNVTKNFNIGLFEAIISGDSLGSFEVGYLNPVIFYRAIEQYGGSQDNAMVGMDLKWNFLNHFQVYGQFALDEFLLSAYRENNGWWANKWALQMGTKYVDVLGVRNLDLQLEWNRVRPFMYSHLSEYTNYTHYSQSLAHPFGANFDEKLAVLRYQPAGRWMLEATFMQTKYGGDEVGSNYGGNIFKDYNTRSREYGNTLGQGVATQVQMADLTVSYMPAHRLYLELTQTFRKQESEMEARNRNASITQLGMRWNFARRTHLF